VVEHLFSFFFVAQKPLDESRLLWRLHLYLWISEALPVPSFVNMAPARGHAAANCHDPCTIHAVIDLKPRFPGSLGNFKANAW
jgi:hypothetical protein